MENDQRKFLRFECMLPAEIIKVEEQDGRAEKARIDDFSRGGLKLVLNLDFNFIPGSKIELKCSLPDKADAAQARAETVWSRNEGGTWSLGLKILDMDPEARAKVLDSCYSQWQEKMLKG
ncbi:MAG TPA: PilZ domain-containing protein [Acidobacteriota bacterium]|nr:PilZ domain-containing protein [Acidobacteriota bacterium]